MSRKLIQLNLKGERIEGIRSVLDLHRRARAKERERERERERKREREREREGEREACNGCHDKSELFVRLSIQGESK